MAPARDFYEVLGVPRTASQDDIQRAYRKLARQHHPDVSKDPDSEENFKQVSEAYDVLSDPEARKRYNAFGPDFRRMAQDVDPEAFSRTRRGRTRAGRAGGARERAGEDFTADVDLDDLFGSMFGGVRTGDGRAAGRWGRYRVPTRRPSWMSQWTRLTEAAAGPSRSRGRMGPGRSR